MNFLFPFSLLIAEAAKNPDTLMVLGITNLSAIILLIVKSIFNERKVESQRRLESHLRKNRVAELEFAHQRNLDIILAESQRTSSSLIKETKSQIDVRAFEFLTGQQENKEILTTQNRVQEENQIALINAIEAGTEVSKKAFEEANNVNVKLNKLGLNKIDSDKNLMEEVCEVKSLSADSNKKLNSLLRSEESKSKVG